MQISIFILIFCAVLGVLIVAYFHHFRYRAMVMGPERLMSALSRTVCEGEDAPPEELREGLLELESRLRRAIQLNSCAVAIILAASLGLTVFSTLSELALALSGVAILLIGVLCSLLLLRDILRSVHANLEGAGEED